MEALRLAINARPTGAPALRENTGSRRHRWYVRVSSSVVDNSTIYIQVDSTYLFVPLDILNRRCSIVKHSQSCLSFSGNQRSNLHNCRLVSLRLLDEVTTLTAL